MSSTGLQLRLFLSFLCAAIAKIYKEVLVRVTDCLKRPNLVVRPLTLFFVMCVFVATSSSVRAELTADSGNPYLLGSYSGSSLVAGMAFNAAGTKLYTPNFGDNKIYTFDVSSPFDLKNTTSSLDFSTNASGPTAILFNNDGSKVYILDTAAHNIKSAVLSTPYDLSSGNLTALVTDYTITHGGLQSTGMGFLGSFTARHANTHQFHTEF